METVKIDDATNTKACTAGGDEKGAGIVSMDAKDSTVETNTSSSTEKGTEMVSTDAQDSTVKAIASCSTEKGAEMVSTDAQDSTVKTIASCSTEKGAEMVSTDAKNSAVKTNTSSSSEKGVEMVNVDTKDSTVEAIASCFTEKGAEMVSMDTKDSAVKTNTISSSEKGVEMVNMDTKDSTVEAIAGCFTEKGAEMVSMDTKGSTVETMASCSTDTLWKEDQGVKNTKEENSHNEDSDSQWTDIDTSDEEDKVISKKVSKMCGKKGSKRLKKSFSSTPVKKKVSSNLSDEEQKNYAFISEQLTILNDESCSRTDIDANKHKKEPKKMFVNKQKGARKKIPKKHNVSKSELDERNAVRKKLETTPPPTPQKVSGNIDAGVSSADDPDTSQDALQIDEEELDERLDKKAQRAGLTAVNVKNIIHELVKNADVQQMLRNHMTQELSNMSEAGNLPYEPKMTRAKVKEVIEKGAPLQTWPLSPVKKTTAAKKPSILDIDFPDDEEDDEYSPDKDADAQHESDDDLESMMSSQASDLGSPMPPTPSTPTLTNPFTIKTPQTGDTKTFHSPMSSVSGMSTRRASGLGQHFKSSMAALEENLTQGSETQSDTIARRTRSKLPLTDTSLTAIEEAFVAPDITPDMYDTECDDSEWQEFLQSLVKPNAETVDDDVNDPEFDFFEEAEKVQETDEDFRFDKPFRVSKKELNQLITELDILFPEQDEEDKTLELEDSLVNESVEEENPRKRRRKSFGNLNRSELIDNSLVVSPEERLLIEDQMRKHVQLTSQLFFLCKGSEDFEPMTGTCLQLLRELDIFRCVSMAGELSSYNVCNLQGALDLVQEERTWDLQHELENASVYSVEDNGSSDLEATDGSKKARRKCVTASSCPLLPAQMEVMWNSKVFLYPQLLPIQRLLTLEEAKQCRLVFTPAEDNLIALAYEQFKDLKHPRKLMQKYLLPAKSVKQITTRIKNLKAKRTPDNALRDLIKNQKPIQRALVVEAFYIDQVKAPRDHDDAVLPSWAKKQRSKDRAALREGRKRRAPRKRSSSLSLPRSTGKKRRCKKNLDTLRYKEDEKKEHNLHSEEENGVELELQMTESKSCKKRKPRSVPVSPTEAADTNRRHVEDSYSFTSAVQSQKTILTSEGVFIPFKDLSAEQTRSLIATLPQVCIDPSTIALPEQGSIPVVPGCSQDQPKVISSLIAVPGEPMQLPSNIMLEEEGSAALQQTGGTGGASSAMKVGSNSATEVETTSEVETRTVATTSTASVDSLTASSSLQSIKEAEVSTPEASAALIPEEGVAADSSEAREETTGFSVVIEKQSHQDQISTNVSMHNDFVDECDVVTGGEPTSEEASEHLIPQVSKSNEIISTQDKSESDVEVDVEAIDEGDGRNEVAGSFTEAKTDTNTDVSGSNPVAVDSVGEGGGNDFAGCDSEDQTDSDLSGHKSVEQLETSDSASERPSHLDSEEYASVQHPADTSSASQTNLHLSGADSVSLLVEKSVSEAKCDSSCKQLADSKEKQTAEELNLDVSKSSPITNTQVAHTENSEKGDDFSDSNNEKTFGNLSVATPETELPVQQSSDSEMDNTAKDMSPNSSQSQTDHVCVYPATPPKSTQPYAVVDASPVKQESSPTKVTLTPLEIIAAFCPYYSPSPASASKPPTPQQRLLERTPPKRNPEAPFRDIRPKPCELNDSPLKPFNSPILSKVSSKSPKKVLRGNRTILPKSYLYENESPTKRAARSLRKKAQMICQRTSPCKLLPQSELQRIKRLQLSPLKAVTVNRSRRKQAKPVKKVFNRPCFKRSVSKSDDLSETEDKTDSSKVRGRKRKLSDGEKRQEESDEGQSEVEETGGMSQEDSQNEDEAEDNQSADQNHLDMLMAASTTLGFGQKKSGIGRERNKGKTQKKKEQSLAVLAPDLLEADPRRDEKDTAFAQAYLDKVQESLKHQPEIYEEFLSLMYHLGKDEQSAVETYHKLEVLFKDFPELLDEFAGFLLPEQALVCGCFMKNRETMKARTFLRKLEVYYEKQPSHFQRILKVMSQWYQNPQRSPQDLQSSLLPLLRGMPHLIEEFSLFFPDEKPPKSYMSDFETVTLNDSDFEDGGSVDSFEEVDIPDQFDPYRTKWCTCDCHQDPTQVKHYKRLLHCLNCCLKVMDGKLYFQPSSKKLHPAKVVMYKPVSPPPPQTPPPTNTPPRPVELEEDQTADKENLNCLGARPLVISPSVSHTSPARAKRIKLKISRKKAGQKRFLTLCEIGSSPVKQEPETGNVDSADTAMTAAENSALAARSLRRDSDALIVNPPVTLQDELLQPERCESNSSSNPPHATVSASLLPVTSLLPVSSSASVPTSSSVLPASSSLSVSNTSCLSTSSSTLSVPSTVLSSSVSLATSVTTLCSTMVTSVDSTPSLETVSVMSPVQSTAKAGAFMKISPAKGPMSPAVTQLSFGPVRSPASPDVPNNVKETKVGGSTIQGGKTLTIGSGISALSGSSKCNDDKGTTGKKVSQNEESRPRTTTVGPVSAQPQVVPAKEGLSFPNLVPADAICNSNVITLNSGQQLTTHPTTSTNTLTFGSAPTVEQPAVKSADGGGSGAGFGMSILNFLDGPAMQGDASVSCMSDILAKAMKTADIGKSDADISMSVDFMNSFLASNFPGSTNASPIKTSGADSGLQQTQTLTTLQEHLMRAGIISKPFNIGECTSPQKQPSGPISVKSSQASTSPVKVMQPASTQGSIFLAPAPVTNVQIQPSVVCIPPVVTGTPIVLGSGVPITVSTQPAINPALQPSGAVVTGALGSQTVVSQSVQVSQNSAVKTGRQTVVFGSGLISAMGGGVSSTVGKQPIVIATIPSASTNQDASQSVVGDSQRKVAGNSNIILCSQPVVQSTISSYTAGIETVTPVQTENQTQPLHSSQQSQNVQTASVKFESMRQASGHSLSHGPAADQSAGPPQSIDPEPVMGEEMEVGEESEVEWTKDMDKMCLEMCKNLGPVEETFARIAEKLKVVTPNEVASRFVKLLELLANYVDDEDEDDDDSD